MSQTFTPDVEALIEAQTDRLAATAPPAPDSQFDYADPRDVADDALRQHLARIPSQFRAAFIADLTTSPVDQHPAEVARWVADPDARTLILAGEVGTGKSHVAAAALTEWFVQRLAARRLPPATAWWSMAALLTSLRFTDADDAREVIRQASTAPLVVFDDIALVRATPFAVETVQSVIDTRLGRGLRQIVTTNAAWPVLVETWGKPMTDRLRAGSLTLTFTGQSLRRPLPWQPRNPQGGNR